jgi:hypothetical protein
MNLLGSLSWRISRSPHFLAFLLVLRVSSLPVTVGLALILSLLLLIVGLVLAALMVIL